MDRRYRVNTPAVASEIIDGEAVIMNLKSGAYFSTRQVGCLLWGWLEQGIQPQAMADSLATAFAASPEVLTEAVESFIAKLVEHDLIRQLPADAAARLGAAVRQPVLESGHSGQSFSPPELEVYSDMQDLLLLDPIHDVDDEAGWPRPKPTTETVL